MIEYVDVEQGSPEWFQARLGLPTASCFGDLMASKGRGGAPPRTRLTYLWKLAGEILTGEPMDSYVNRHMERGKEREDEARALYELRTGNEVLPVGFIRNGNCGASPDGAIETNGLLELKDALPHIQIERLLDGTLPAEHKPQVQGQLMVSEREWVDFVSHCRGLPPLIVRVYRDEPYIAELRAGVDRFCAELDDLVARLRAME